MARRASSPSTAGGIARWKKVLFVAEKLTALDVVKSRLEAVGLGEFILPLQAGRSTSDRVYEGLAARLEAAPAPSHSDGVFESRRRHLESERSKLQSYLDALSASFEGSGMTVHEVLGHAIATADIRKKLPRHLRRNLPLPPMTADDIETVLGSIQHFDERLKRLSEASPIWMGAGKVISSAEDANDLAETAGEIVSSINAFEQAFDDSPMSPCISSKTDIDEVLVGFLAMHGLADGQYTANDLEPLLAEAARRAVSELLGFLEELQSVNGRLSRHLKSPDAEGTERRLRKAIEFAKCEGNGKLFPEAHEKAATEAANRLTQAKPLQIEISSLPRQWRESTQSLVKISEGLQRLFAHSENARSFGQTLSRDSRNSAEALASRANDLHSRLCGVQSDLPHVDASWTSVAKLDQLVRAAGVLGDTGLFGRMGSPYRTAKQFFETTLGGNQGLPGDRCAEKLRLAASLLEEIKGFAEDRRAIELFGARFDGLNTDFDAIREAVDAAEEMRSLAESSVDVVEALAALKEDRFRQLLSKDPSSPFSELFELTPKAISGVIEDMTETIELESRRAADALGYMDLFIPVGNEEALELEYLEGLAEDKARCAELIEAINKSDAWIHVPGVSTGDEYVGKKLHERLAAIETLLRLEDSVLSLKLLGSHGFDVAKSSIEAISEAANRSVELAASLASAIDLRAPQDVWAVRDLKSAFQSASAAPSDLLERGRLARSEQELQQAGLGEFVKWLQEPENERQNLAASELARAAISKAMADEAVVQHRGALEGYSGEDFDRIRTTIAQRDRELVQLSREVIRNSLISSASPPSGNGIGRKSAFTDMALLNNELSKKKRRVGVRELTRRAGRALVELKPCWMMSPLAVAQYLHDGLSFDLLVVDEASQMTPENAVGALRRVEQAVDVMFISTLYGPERPGGPVMQGFGPINSVHGHRRLNVLFSRAKSRIITFTSMNPGDIRVDDNKAKGVRMFRAWLEYSGSGRLPENASVGGNTDMNRAGFAGG